MRLLASTLAVVLAVASLSACQGDAGDSTDYEEFVTTNDDVGPVLDFPDGSRTEVEVRAFFPGRGFEDCEVELLADAFEFDAPEEGDNRFVVQAVGLDEDLDALAECAGLIDPDD